jgi:hypothetical protein
MIEQQKEIINGEGKEQKKNNHNILEDNNDYINIGLKDKNNKNIENNKYIKTNINIGTIDKEKYKNQTNWKIGTINVRGINVITKQMEITEYIKQHKLDIIGISETKISSETENISLKWQTNI